MNHKYTGLALFAALVAIGAPPAYAESAVVSQNTVGYSKLTMAKGSYTLIANPFVDVATGENIAIKDMFAEDKTEANAGTSPTTADTIEVWTGEGYQSYYFRSTPTAKYWMKVGGRNETLDEIPEGQGAFYHNNSEDSDVTLTISGEVKSEPEVLTIVPGYNLVKNPFPTELSFDCFDVAGATAGSSPTTADTIEVWTGNGYKNYFYRSANPKPYWMQVGGRNKTTDTLAPYEGFFYKSIGNTEFTVTVESPLATSSGN